MCFLKKYNHSNYIYFFFLLKKKIKLEYLNKKKKGTNQIISLY